MEKHTFKSAGNYPYKLLVHAKEYIECGFRPTHIFVYPTNKCNLNCSYCCCQDENRNGDDMSFATFKNIVTLTRPKAITFAGGGEPTMHPEIVQFVEFVKESFKHMKMGIMTNGLRCESLPVSFWRSLDWVRISMDADRIKTPWLDHPNLSYIWSDHKESPIPTLDPPLLQELKHKAMRHQIKDLRLMPDIHSSEGYEHGDRICFMPLVRPVFAPDGAVYACCRAHYAIKGSNKRLPKELCVAKDAKEYMDKYSVFNGSGCDRCFYGPFNRLMFRIKMAMGTKDVEFI